MARRERVRAVDRHERVGIRDLDEARVAELRREPAAHAIGSRRAAGIRIGATAASKASGARTSRNIGLNMHGSIRAEPYLPQTDPLPQ